jgi:hypothetical protein
VSAQRKGSDIVAGCTALIAPRAEDRSVLFRLLNANDSGTFLGAGFLITAAHLPGRYVGMW